MLKEGYVTDYSLTIRHRDGQLTDVVYNASVYKDVSGSVLGVFAAARDVTQTRQASQYARSLIEASVDPLVTISPEGKITDVNEATIKVTGVPREKMIGTDFSDYFTEPEKARQGYQQVLKEGFVTDYSLTIRHRNGQLTDVVYNASVYKDVSGSVLGVFAAARDVTQTRQASQYARSLIEASVDPLVTISPEGKITDVNEATIKVTGVPREKMIGTDFSDYFTEPEKARQGYQQVLKESYVTDYALTIRHRNGKLTDVLYNASVYKDVSGSVLGVFAAARDVTAQKKAEEEVTEQRKKELIKLAELDIKPLLNAPGDSSMVRQVMVNLISNAIKYSGKKEVSIIEIGSYEQGGDIVYYVKDNGAGFEMQYYNKLFGVFQRLHDSDEFEGTGVGLAIVQRIVARHNGKVWAEGKLDEGATFYFSLPALKNQIKS